jgi:hypothetical protein
MITQPPHDEVGRYEVQCWPKAGRIGRSRVLQTVIVRKGRLTKPGQDSSCMCRRFAIMCRKPTDYRGQQSSRQRQRGTSARICGNSDLPSGREMVSTESYLLSSAVGRI